MTHRTIVAAPPWAYEEAVVIHRRFFNDVDHVLSDDCWCKPVVVDARVLPLPWEPRPRIKKDA